MKAGRRGHGGPMAAAQVVHDQQVVRLGLSEKQLAVVTLPMYPAPPVTRIRIG